MILKYENKDYAKITDIEAEEIKNAKGMHLNFRGNLLKMSKVEIMSEEMEEIKVWQKSTEDLKEIAGSFREQLKAHTEGIPKTIAGKHKAVQDGLLPDVGGWWIEDRGVVTWYIQNGWIETTKKEGEKRKWALTTKYISDKIPQVEEATEELRCRKLYAEEQAIEHGDPIIKEIYENEQREKIDAMRKKLALKFGWQYNYGQK